MVDTRRISICVTTWNRDALTVRSYAQVLNDERVSEIVVVDDKSEPAYVNKLQRLTQHPKVRLFLNQKNLGCYKNKAYAISQASSEFVIILDSDNIIDCSFIDRLFSVSDWQPDTILAPDYARPHFDYTAFSGITLDRHNVKQYIPKASKNRFDCLINTMNYFTHRDEYLRVHDSSIEPWTADTIYQNYNWLKAGNKIHVLKGLQYLHDIHNITHAKQEGSHYQRYVKHTGNLYKDIENKMMRL